MENDPVRTPPSVEFFTLFFERFPKGVVRPSVELSTFILFDRLSEGLLKKYHGSHHVGSKDLCQIFYPIYPTLACGLTLRLGRKSVAISPATSVKEGDTEAIFVGPPMKL